MDIPPMSFQGESIEMPKKQATVGGPPRSRSIAFGPLRPQASTFASNEVTTAKYTKWNFIPKSIYEQFRRVANIYFLIISLLQVRPMFRLLFASIHTYLHCEI
jgi:hypothetical protein